MWSSRSSRSRGAVVCRKSGTWTLTPKKFQVQVQAVAELEEVKRVWQPLSSPFGISRLMAAHQTEESTPWQLLSRGDKT
jgi:hypothetical protein